MKKLIAVIFALATTSVFAAVVPVLDVELRNLTTRDTDVDTRFYVDPDTREGFVQVEVEEAHTVYRRGCHYDRYGRCYPTTYTDRVYRTVFKDTVKVDGLMLMDKSVVLHTAEGDVECGTYGLSRVLKRPTIYLSGKCDIQGRVIGTREGDRLQVSIKTK